MEYDRLTQGFEENQKLASEIRDVVKDIKFSFDNVGDSMTSIQLYNMVRSLLKVSDQLLQVNDSMRIQWGLLIVISKPLFTPPAPNGAATESE